MIHAIFLLARSSILVAPAFSWLWLLVILQVGVLGPVAGTEALAFLGQMPAGFIILVALFIHQCYVERF
jgi:hypothetical protein